MLKNITDQLQKPGAVGVIPTDTVYGLVARANDKAAVERLYELKKKSP
jgi:L-threonylcarbamoyladenylate synthase